MKVKGQSRHKWAPRITKLIGDPNNSATYWPFQDPLCNTVWGVEETCLSLKLFTPQTNGLLDKKNSKYSFFFVSNYCFSSCRSPVIVIVGASFSLHVSLHPPAMGLQLYDKQQSVTEKSVSLCIVIPVWKRMTSENIRQKRKKKST